MLYFQFFCSLLGEFMISFLLIPSTWKLRVFAELVVIKSSERNLKIIKIIYPRGVGPIYELYSSSRRTAVVSLLKNYMQFFLVIFLGWVMLPRSQATSTDQGGPRTSDLSREVTTSPLLPFIYNVLFIQSNPSSILFHFLNPPCVFFIWFIKKLSSIFRPTL